VQDAASFLSANGYLASNVALLKLRSGTYLHQCRHIERLNYPMKRADRFHLLNALFGADIKFSADDTTGKTFMELAKREASIGYTTLQKFSER
jgi:hypothetical protein